MKKLLIIVSALLSATLAFSGCTKEKDTSVPIETEDQTVTQDLPESGEDDSSIEDSPENDDEAPRPLPFIPNCGLNGLIIGMLVLPYAPDCENQKPAPNMNRKSDDSLAKPRSPKIEKNSPKVDGR